jgi:hypothetical protein
VLVLHARGRLDIAAVRALQQRLDAENGLQTVVLDLEGTHGAGLLSLAVLARDPRRRVRPPVVVRGLSEHHLRLLRHLGFDAGEAEPRPVGLA